MSYVGSAFFNARLLFIIEVAVNRQYSSDKLNIKRTYSAYGWFFYIVSVECCQFSFYTLDRCQNGLSSRQLTLLRGPSSHTTVVFSAAQLALK